MQACVEMVGESARKAQITLHNGIEPTGGPMLLVDATLLKEIMINLLSNAKCAA